MFELVPVIGTGHFCYTWMLNPITSIDKKAKLDFGQFTSKQEALDWYNAHRTKDYHDDYPDPVTTKMQHHVKFFQKGSPLEWMNHADHIEPDQNGFGLHRVLVQVTDIQEVKPEAQLTNEVGDDK